ncbi:Ribonuclease D [Phycisphaerae bacterium RAS1]|nr:Ribonuclease D [Phycisphaerae bacterium RAS1]
MEHPQIITDQHSLNALCDTCRVAGVFAFDTEFIRDDTFDAILCLVQVAVGRDVVLVDPVSSPLDLAPFWALVSDPNIRTIVHAGKEDCDLCCRLTRQPPRNLFDVQIAAGFAGFGYPLSLARLVELVTRQRLAKAQTLTDWSRRPLTPQQVHYAIEDVAYLPAIYEKLSGWIAKRGRADWIAEEMARFESPLFYRPPTEDRLFKIKGAKRLDGLGLVVLARLVEWRERWARERNRPVRALIRDDILVEIARRRPKQASDLEVLRGFPQAKNAKVVSDLIDVIAQAERTPRSEWPDAHEPREDTPMVKATLDVLSAVTRAICFEEDVSNDLVGGPQRLRELIDFDRGLTSEEPVLLKGWRGEFIGRRLIDLLEGRSELHLSGWPERPKLEVRRGSKKSEVRSQK